MFHKSRKAYQQWKRRSRQRTWDRPAAPIGAERWFNTEECWSDTGEILVLKVGDMFRYEDRLHQVTKCVQHADGRLFFKAQAFEG